MDDNTYADENTYAPDISYVNISPDVLYDDGCDFNKPAIVCKPESRKPGQCDKCGWNPRVARRRSYLIRKEMDEQNHAAD